MTKFKRFLEKPEEVPSAVGSGTRLRSDLELIDMNVFDQEQVDDIARIVGGNYLVYLEFVSFQKSMGHLGVATLLAFESIYRDSKGLLMDLALIKGYMEIMRRNSADFGIDILPVLHKLVSSYPGWDFPELERFFRAIIYAVNSVYLVRMQKQFVNKDWGDYGEFMLFWNNVELLVKGGERKDGFDFLKQTLEYGLN